MERRVLIAVVLSFVVLYTYPLLVPTAGPTRDVESGSPAPDGSGAPPLEEESRQEAVTPAAAQTATASEVQAILSEPTERQVEVDTTTVRAVFSNRGAQLVSWQLKGHLDENGGPVDLVPRALPPTEPRPFSLRVEDPAITLRLNGSLYRMSGETGGRLDGTSGARTLTFEYEDSDGVKARKEFEFQPDGYLVTFSATVEKDGGALNPSIEWGPGLGDAGASSGGGSFFTGNYVQPPEAIYHREGEVERITIDSLADQPRHEGAFLFAGIDDHYFLAVAVNPGQARLDYRRFPATAPAEAERRYVAQTFQFPQGIERVRFFVGPKQLDQLRSVEPELVRAINFGIFAWLAVPLLGALTWVHGFAGNYGWSIIILTILINIAIFPLRHKSVVSMRKMQILQPQLKAIQDRYAGLKVTDPARQKMNTEIMALYKEKGVNPASGCVPMLLTMPVLFAFYSLLSQAIELRGAEFGWWIRDLSQHDPYYVTPVLMGASMFWQQKITPTSMDPAQQRIMMIMPLMFSFMFLRAPSGLVVYWFVSQIWAIGQQYFTNWLIGPAPVHVVRPPAERRLKNAGSGKSAGAEKET